MAGIAGTLTGLYVPFTEKTGDRSPKYMDYIQTACSLATTTALDVFAKSQADLDTYLLTLQVMCHWSATAVTGIVRARVCADDTLYTVGIVTNEDSVTAHQTLSMNFSPVGLNIGTNSATTAATASCYV